MLKFPMHLFLPERRHYLSQHDARLGRRRRRRHSRHRRHRRLSARYRAGIVLLVLLLGSAFGAMVWLLSAEETVADFDPETYCPALGSYAKTVLLIDRTNAMSVNQQRKLKDYLRGLTGADVMNAVPQYTMLSVYLVDATDATVAPLPLVEVCNPGSGDDISEFAGDPHLANQRFTERIEQPVAAAIGSAVPGEASTLSPIIESIRGIAQVAFAEAPQPGYNHRLIVVSDMLQDSASASPYREGQDLSKIDVQPLAAELGNVAAVDVKLTEHKDAVRLQGDALVGYWRRYFQASGSNLHSTERWAE